MATKKTVLTVTAATGISLLLGILAVTVRETRTRESVTGDEADMRHHRHHEVLATQFAPRSHGGQGEVGPLPA
jgi:hypothetical protein